MNEPNLLIGIAGILFTMLLGVFGIRLTIKLREKVGLTFLQRDCFSVFNTLTRNLRHVEIKYKNHPISENLVYLKGTLLNSGNVDLDKSNIHKPISFNLPENFSFLETNIINTSSDFRIETTIKPNSIIFEWDLLITNEYFTFSCLMECSNRSDSISTPSKLFPGCFNIKSRIKNLSKVDCTEAPKKLSLEEKLFLPLGLLMGLFMSLSFLVGQFIDPDYDLKHQINLDLKAVEATVRAIGPAKLALDSKSDDISDEVHLDTFNDWDSKLVIKPQKVDIVLFIIGIVMFFLVIVGGYAIISRNIKDKKILKLFEEGVSSCT